MRKTQHALRVGAPIFFFLGFGGGVGGVREGFFVSYSNVFL
jgi:hypothetical protein